MSDAMGWFLTVLDGSGPMSVHRRSRIAAAVSRKVQRSFQSDYIACFEDGMTALYYSVGVFCASRAEHHAVVSATWHGRSWAELPYPQQCGVIGHNKTFNNSWAINIVQRVPKTYPCPSTTDKTSPLRLHPLYDPINSTSLVSSVSNKSNSQDG